MHVFTSNGNIKESKFSGSNRPQFDQNDTGSKIVKGRDAAQEFNIFLTHIKKIIGNKTDWSYKVKGDTVLINYEDDSAQQEEYHAFEIKVIKDIVSGG